MATAMELLAAGDPDDISKVKEYVEKVRICLSNYSDMQFSAQVKELYSPAVYFELEKYLNSMQISHKVKEIYDNVKKEYNLAREPWVIADTNEKGNIADLYRIHKITHACCAYKYDKDAALDQLADFVHSSKIKVCPDAKAVKNDADLMLWKRDDESDKILHELDDDTYHGNAMFALLYVNRQFAVDVMGSTTAKTAKELIEEDK
jgi:hypothetical protein